MWGYGPVIFACIGLQASAVAGLNLVDGSEATWPVWVIGVLLGASSGAVSQLAIPLLRQMIPSPLLGRCLGLQAFYIAGASSLGALLMGILADLPGGYSTGLIVNAATAAAALPLGLLLVIGSRRQPAPEDDVCQPRNEGTAMR